MADPAQQGQEQQQQQQQDQQPAAFPQPPPWYTQHTDANVAKLAELRAEAGLARKDEEGGGTSAGSQDPVPASDLAVMLKDNLPVNMETLIPPAPPGEWEGFRVFGEVRTLSTPPAPLPPEIGPLAGVSRASTEPVAPATIVRLTRAALLAFLEMVHILATNPDGMAYGLKWEDVRDVMANAHRALNLYRPWAAKEDLIRVLEQWVARARREVDDVDRLEARLAEVMRGIAGDDGDGGDAMQLDAVEEAKEANGVNEASSTTGINGIRGSNTPQQSLRTPTDAEGSLWSMLDEADTMS